MILEYIIDYRSSSGLYERCFLDSLKKHSLQGKLIKDGFKIKCYVEADDTDDFSNFATDFAKKLPHSIFLYDTKVSVIEDMPDDEYVLENIEKRDTPFCLECLENVLDEKSQNYYDIFKSCKICGYNVEGKHRSYEEEFKRMATAIKDGKNIKLTTFYGTYNVGKISKICDEIDCDIVAYDYATIQKYTHVKDYELKALASIEKPFIRLKTNIKFKMDIEELQNELIRFKLPDDFILYFLLKELNQFGIDMIFMTKESIETQEEFVFAKPINEKEPIEVVVSQKHIAIIKGDKGLPEFPVLSTNIAPIVGATYSVIKEHNLKDMDVAGIYLSKKYQSGIVIYGKKFGVINYLSLECNFSSFSDIFEKIRATNETGKKLVESYIAKFPEHCRKILNIPFEKENFNIYELWGLMSIILDFSPSTQIDVASKVLENNSISFLGEKGPRIDYKVFKKNNKTSLDYLMIIRSAMSFKLAGIDDLTLSYGIIESFVEFLANEIESVRENFNIDLVVASGSMLENKKLFAKLSVESSINGSLYFNNQLLVDGANITYGDYC